MSAVIDLFESDDFLSDSSESSESSLSTDSITAFLSERRDAVRIPLYFENVVPRYSGEEFRSHFRMYRSTVEIIRNKIGASISSHCQYGRLTTDPEKQILMALWILATPESFRSVSDRFDVSKSTLWYTCSKVFSALVRISSDIIRWPNEDERRVQAEIFKRVSGFPGVVGCIDGTHIRIKAPHIDAKSYCNRKNFHSVVLQGVVNSSGEFINAYAGEVGSVHDARIFRRSRLSQQLSHLVPDTYHLLGDAAYPLLTNLMVPFRDNGHLSNHQKKYNKALSQTRVVVERAFGLLKGRFRRLKCLDMLRIDLMPTVIVAACVLHNICLNNNDVIDDTVPPNDDDEIVLRAGHTSTQAKAKRLRIMYSL